MATFNILKLSLANYKTLKTNGTVTINGTTYTYSPSTTLYITDKMDSDKVVDLGNDNKFAYVLEGQSLNNDLSMTFNTSDFADALEAAANGKPVVAHIRAYGEDICYQMMASNTQWESGVVVGGLMIFRGVADGDLGATVYFSYLLNNNTITATRYFREPYIFVTSDAGDYPSLSVSDISDLISQSIQGRPCFVHCSNEGYTYFADVFGMKDNGTYVQENNYYLGYITLKDVYCNAYITEDKVYKTDVIYQNYSYNSSTDTITLEVIRQVYYEPYQLILNAHTNLSLPYLTAGEIRNAINSVFPSANSAANCKYRPIVMHWLNIDSGIVLDMVATSYERLGTTYYISFRGKSLIETQTGNIDYISCLNMTFKVDNTMLDSDNAKLLIERGAGTEVTVGGNVVSMFDADTKANVIVVAPLYSTSSTYAVGDLVMYNGVLYECNTAIASGESFTAAKWTQKDIKTLFTVKQDKTDNSLQTTSKTIAGAINELKQRADSATSAIGYSSYSALITALNAAAADAFNVGQIFLIQTKDVPDMWILSIESSSVTYTYTTDEQFIADTNAAGGCQVGYFKIAQSGQEYIPIENYAELDKIAPAYSASSTYTVGKIVHNGANFYVCSTAVTAAESFDVAKWTQITIADAIEAKQDKITSANLSSGTVVTVIGFDSSNNLIKGALSGIVSSIGGKSGAITLGAGLSIDSNNEMTAQAELEIVNLL